MTNQPTARQIKNAWKASGKHTSLREYAKKEYGMVNHRGRWMPSSDTSRPRGRGR